MKTKRTYIPALRFYWLTPLYDPVLRWLMQEERFKRILIQEADVQSGQRVLDVGCGTATLTVMIKRAQPDASVTGIDGDPQVLKIGQAKAEKAGIQLTLDQGMAYNLPYPGSSFDRVVSSLMFHHLVTQDKQQTLKEIYRVLKPNGTISIVDFGPPDSFFARLLSPITSHLEEVGDLHKGLIPVMMRTAGFKDVAVTHHFATVFGTINLYAGRKS